MGKSTLTKSAYLLPDNLFELKKTYLHLWVDLDVKLMYSEWLLAPTAEEYSEACELFVKTVQEHAVECWIADSKLLASLSVSDQKRIILRLAPVLFNTSLRKLARITNKDFHSTFMFEDLSRSLTDKHHAAMEIQQFISFEDAADWVGMIRG